VRCFEHACRLDEETAVMLATDHPPRDLVDGTPAVVHALLLMAAA
jgi:hypothetical protein